jgi:hypothetical protein
VELVKDRLQWRRFASFNCLSAALLFQLSFLPKVKMSANDITILSVCLSPLSTFEAVGVF